MNNFFTDLIHERASIRDRFYGMNVSINLNKFEEGSRDLERNPIRVKDRAHLSKRESWMLTRQDHKDSCRVAHAEQRE
jgi:hypothetical protein